jgi:hypothetical protein
MSASDPATRADCSLAPPHCASASRLSRSSRSSSARASPASCWIAWKRALSLLSRRSTLFSGARGPTNMERCGHSRPWIARSTCAGVGGCASISIRMRQALKISARDRLIAWLFFTVVVSLLPVAGGLLFDVDHGEGLHAARAVAHGELLVLSVTITAAAVGELVLTGIPSGVRSAALVLIGSAFTIIIVAGFWFADISSIARSPSRVDHISDGSLAIGSGAVLCLSLFVSAQCVRVASKIHATL